MPISPSRSGAGLDFGSAAKVKEVYERLQSRMHSFRKNSEKQIERGFTILENNGALFAWGYANERWGKTADVTSGLNEITIVGVPADLGVGLGLLGLSFFGGLGKYAEHGVNLGNGSTGAFAYRMGADLGRKGAQHATTTSGAPAQMSAGAARVPVGGRAHHVEYAPR
jgi:hypothetical protein